MSINDEPVAINMRIQRLVDKANLVVREAEVRITRAKLIAKVSQQLRDVAQLVRLETEVTRARARNLREMFRRVGSRKSD